MFQKSCWNGSRCPKITQSCAIFRVFLVCRMLRPPSSAAAMVDRLFSRSRSYTILSTQAIVLVILCSPHQMTFSHNNNLQQSTQCRHDKGTSTAPKRSLFHSRLPPRPRLHCIHSYRFPHSSPILNAAITHTTLQSIRKWHPQNHPRTHDTPAKLDNTLTAFIHSSKSPRKKNPTYQT